MGCDIHMVVEKYWNEKWVGIGKGTNLANSRNYDRFAKLAGVRGAGPNPRGLPPNASDLSLIEVERWDGDGHSYSWGEASGLLPIFIQTERHHFKYTLNEADYFGIFIDVARGETLDDFRVVYWFDN